MDMSVIFCALGRGVWVLSLLTFWGLFSDLQTTPMVHHSAFLRNPKFLFSNVPQSLLLNWASGLCLQVLFPVKLSGAFMPELSEGVTLLKYEGFPVVMLPASHPHVSTEASSCVRNPELGSFSARQGTVLM